MESAVFKLDDFMNYLKNWHRKTQITIHFKGTLRCCDFQKNLKNKKIIKNRKIRKIGKIQTSQSTLKLNIIYFN